MVFYFCSSINTRWSWLTSLKRFLLRQDSFYRFFRTWCLCWGTRVKCLVSPVPQLKSLWWSHCSQLKSLLEHHCSQPSSQNVMEYFPIGPINPKGLVFRYGGVSSAHAIRSKGEEEPRKKEKMSHFSITRPQHVFPGRGEKRNSRIRGGTGQGPSLGLGQLMKILPHKQTN